MIFCKICINTLALALLFSQFLAFAHGIAHAGWPPSVASVESSRQASFNAALFNYVDIAAGVDDDDVAHGDDKLHAGHGKHHHSCIDYDAAAGASGIHADFFSSPLIPGIQVLALWQAFASWDAPVVCHFSSRAPPR